MNTNDRLSEFLKKHLRSEDYDPLLNYVRSDFIRSSRSTFLMSISNHRLSDDALTLVQQFLKTLSKEEASEYIAQANYFGDTILFSCDVKMIKIVLEYIADINICNKQGNNALMQECLRSHTNFDIDKIKILLDNKIDVNNVNENNMTALMYCCCAIKYNSSAHIIEALELLIYCGADVTMKSTHNFTAYDYLGHIDKYSTPERLLQLLQGIDKINCTKRAM